MQSARSEVGGWGGVPTYATINQSVESIESSKRVMAEKRRSSVGVEKTATACTRCVEMDMGGCITSRKIGVRHTTTPYLIPAICHTETIIKQPQHDVCRNIELHTTICDNI